MVKVIDDSKILELQKRLDVARQKVGPHNKRKKRAPARRLPPEARPKGG